MQHQQFEFRILHVEFFQSLLNGDFRKFDRSLSSRCVLVFGPTFEKMTIRIERHRNSHGEKVSLSHHDPCLRVTRLRTDEPLRRPCHVHMILRCLVEVDQ